MQLVRLWLLLFLKLMRHKLWGGIHPIVRSYQRQATIYSIYINSVYRSVQVPGPIVIIRLFLGLIHKPLFRFTIWEIKITILMFFLFLKTLIPWYMYTKTGRQTITYIIMHLLVYNVLL